MRTPTTLFLALLAAVALTALPAYAAITVTLSQTTYYPGQSISLTGSGAQSGQPVSIQVLDPNGNIKAVAQVTADVNGAFSATNIYILPATPAGTWSVKAASGGVTATVTFTLASADTTAPTITSATLDKSVVKGGASMTITVEATDNVSVSSVTADTVSLTLSAGKWTGTVTAAATEGSKTITVAATDPSGNKATTTVSYTVDNTAPTITVSSPADGAKVFAADVTITGKVTDNVAVAALTVSGTSVTVAADGSFTTTRTLSIGSNQITLAATDTAGNSKTTTIAVTYTPTPQLTATVETGKTYVAGDKVTIYIQFTTEGALVDPDSVPVKHVHGPTGTTTLGDLTKIHTGWYKVDFTAPSQAGDYAVHIQAKYGGSEANGQSAFTVTGSLATAASVASVSGKIDSAVVTLSSRIDTAVTTLSSRIDSTVGSAVTTLSSRVDSSANTVISRLNDRLTTVENNLKSAVDALKGSLSAAESSIKSAVSSAESNIRQDISGLNNAIEAVKTAVSTAESNIKSAVSSAESSVKTAVSTSETNIRKDVASVLAKVNDVQTAVGGIVSAVNSARDDVKRTVTDLQSSVTKDVDEVEKSVSALKSNLESIDAGLSQTSSFVLVVGIIAAITLVVELAMLIRRK